MFGLIQRIHLQARPRRSGSGPPAASPGAARRRLRLPVTVGVWLFAVPVLAALLPALWGWHPVLVFGGSMGRSLPAGSIAVMRTVNSEDVRTGDIIAVARASGSPIIHRVTDIEVRDGARVATLRGDANRSDDPNPLQLTGTGDRLVYYVPFIGYVLWAFKSPVFLSTLGMVVLVAWTVDLLRRRFLQHVARWSGRALLWAWVVVVAVASAPVMSALFVDMPAVGGNAFATDQLDPPTALGATGGLCVDLAWTPTSDTYTSGYNVLRSTSSTGPFTPIATVAPGTVSAYRDAPPVGTYYYMLQSYYQSWISNPTSAVSSTVVRTWYLHNNPSPPTGPTNSQLDLPLDLSGPTAASLENYDQDRDVAAGLLLKRTNKGLAETDARAFQAWRTSGLQCAVAISGTATLTFWSGLEFFENNRQGSVVAYLRHYNGTTFTTIGEATLTVANWQGGSGTWVQKTISLPGLNYTVPAGGYLELRLQVTDSSERDIMFAYDTAAYPSRLDLP